MSDASLDALWRATDLRAVAAAVAPSGREARNEWWAPCPACGAWDAKDPKWSVSLETGQCKCFKCSATGNLLTVARAIWGNAWRSEWLKASPGAAVVMGGSATPAPARRTSAPTPSEVYAALPVGDLSPLASAWGLEVEWLQAHGVKAYDGGFGFPVFDLDRTTVIDLKRRLLPPVPEGEKKSKTAYGGKAGLFGAASLKSKPTAPVVVVEGEKDWAVTDHGLPEMCVIGVSAGAGCWRPEWTEALRGRDVILALDPDEAGEAGAVKARDLLAGVARSVRRMAPLFVPGPPDAKGRPTWPDGMDLFDALRGPNRRDVRAALQAATEYRPNQESDLQPTIRGLIADQDEPDWLEVGKAIARLMSQAGAVWIRADGEPIVVWGKRTYAVSRSDPHWASMIARWTGESDIDKPGRIVQRALELHAETHAPRDQSTAWCSRKGDALYLALNDDAGRNVRITPDRIEVVNNGDDGVVTLPYRTARPIEVIADSEFSYPETHRTWERTWSFLTTGAREREFLSAYLAAIPLYPLGASHPVLRFRGSHQSGKSTAAKAITAFLYGDPEDVESTTTAALYRLSSRRPVTAIDNLEEKNITKDRDLLDYLLVSATGRKRKKSAPDDPHGVVEHRIRSLLLTTGIEPIGSSLPEVTSRTLEIHFDSKHKAPGFREGRYYEKILAERNLLWNYVFRVCQDALKGIRDGNEKRVMDALPQGISRHNEFWALLSLCLDPSGATPCPVVSEWMEGAALEERRVALDDNPLIPLFLALPAHDGTRTRLKWEIVGTKRRSGSVRFVALHGALCSLAGDTKIPYTLGGPSTLSARMGEGREALEQAGIRFLTKRTREGSVVELEIETAAPLGPSDLPLEDAKP